MLLLLLLCSAGPNRLTDTLGTALLKLTALQELTAGSIYHVTGYNLPRGRGHGTGGHRIEFFAEGRRNLSYSAFYCY